MQHFGLAEFVLEAETVTGTASTAIAFFCVQ
jgi:hypothetical protein